jgi:cold shock CspA family protein
MRNIEPALSAAHEVSGAPRCPDIGSLERLASADVPSAEGAWWITFQVAEHIFNSIAGTDKISLQYLPDLLSRMLDQYENLLREEAVRPIPNDRLQQLAGYVYQAASHILRQPRSNLVKEEARVRPHELGEIRPKTLNWLARQPGRTLKQKLAGDKRVAAMVNRFTYDTIENRVTAHMLNKLAQKIEDRILNGINHEEAYDCNKSDVARYDELERFLQLVRRRNASALGSVVPASSATPNNVLLNDRHYSVIWRAHQMLKAYDSHIASNWAFAFNRYAAAMFWAVAAKLRAVCDVALADEVVTVFDRQGTVGIRSIRSGEDDPGMLSVCLAGKPVSALYQRGTIKFLHKEKRYGFIEGTEGRVFFHAAAVKGNAEFFGLSVQQEVYYVSRKTERGISAELVVAEDGLETLTVSLHGLRLDIEIHTYRAEGARFSIDGSRKRSYWLTPCVHDSPAPGRGVRFEVREGSGEEKKLLAGMYADMGAIRELSDRIAAGVLQDCTLISVRPEAAAYAGQEPKAGGLAFDFAANEPALMCSEGPLSLPARHLYAAVFQEAYLARIGSVYDAGLETVPLNSLLTGEERGFVASTFSKALEHIREGIGIPEQDYFIYLVPDSLDEFSQRIKGYMNAVSKRAYPVWRSVAAAMAWKERHAAENIADWHVLVIDTHEASGNAVLLRAKLNGHIGDIVFEHFAPFGLTDEEAEINHCFIERKYLDLFFEKYRLPPDERYKEHMLRSGAVYRVMARKETQLLFTAPERNDHGWFKLCYDEEIYEIVMQEWKRNFDKYIRTLLRSELPRGAKMDALLVISDHLGQVPLVPDVCVSDARLLGTGDTLRGALAIHDRLKREQPAWYEFLPNLSLEVMKDGHYDELVLIRDESVSSLGEEKRIQVQENLTLEKGHPYYRFPLLKGTAGKGSAEVQAVIEHESFPLKEDLPVRLTVRYRYGDENSYELIVSPVQKDQAPFDAISAKWVKQEFEPREDEIPAFPRKAHTDEELKRLIGYLGQKFSEIEQKFRKSRYVTDHFVQKELEDSLFRLIGNFQTVVLSESLAAETFVKELYKQDLVKYLGELIGLRDYGLLPDAFYQSISGERLDSLKNAAAQFLCSFGPYLSSSLFRYVTGPSEFVNKHRLYGRLLLANADLDTLIDVIVVEFNKEPEAMVRSLRYSIWADETIIPVIYQNRPDFIARMVSFIVSELRRNAFYQSARRYLANLYRDYCEVLLGILRLREDPSFTLLRTGSIQALRVAKYVRKIDAMLYKANLRFRSQVVFSTVKPKPDALRNMSDIGFALSNYLTGELGTNLIQVAAIEDDEDAD